MKVGNIEYVNLEELSKVDYTLVDGEANIKDWHVNDESGESIGKVKDLLVNTEQNAVRYIIVELLDSLSGPIGKVVLIPIGFARLGAEKRQVILPVMHEEQFMQMPPYIIGEVTRDTEFKIRSAIGSPAALRIEEEIVDMDQSDFYQHHHFDRGNFGPSKNDSFGDRELEKKTIHGFVEHAESVRLPKSENEHSLAGKSEQFDIQTQEGAFTIEPQENGTYRVFDQGNKIGVIYAEAAQEGVHWRTMDPLQDHFVSTIGNAITLHNTSTGH